MKNSRKKYVHGEADVDLSGPAEWWPDNEEEGGDEK